jgi:sec-independent protein translocase protein TatA
MVSLALISNLAGPEGLIIIFAVVLLFGAKRLPEIGRSLGQTMREFGKGRDAAEEEEEKKKVPPPE